MHIEIRRSGPQCGRSLKVEYLGIFEYIIETDLDHESGDHLGTVGEANFNKKILCYCPFHAEIRIQLGKFKA